MPKGHDPASLAATDPASLSRCLRSAGPLADELVDNVLRYYEPRLDNAEARICALHESTRLIARLHPNDVARQVGRVSEGLRLSTTEVTKDLLENAGRCQTSVTRARSSSLHGQIRRGNATRRLSR